MEVNLKMKSGVAQTASNDGGINTTNFIISHVERIVTQTTSYKGFTFIALSAWY